MFDVHLLFHTHAILITYRTYS